MRQEGGCIPVPAVSSTTEYSLHVPLLRRNGGASAVKPYFKPYIGSRYSTTKLMILSESAYDWLEGRKQVTPPPTHPRQSLLWAIATFSQRRGYFVGMSRAICGTRIPTHKEMKAAWSEYAYTIFVQGTVGQGARRRPTAKQFRDAGPPFFSVLEKLRPRKVIVTGTDLWKSMPNTSVQFRDDLQAYGLADGTLVWCLAFPHPSNSTVGFRWQDVNERIRVFRLEKLPLRYGDT
jgi:hypothetical protein